MLVPLKTTRFESLLEAVPDALVGMDQEGVIRFVNRQTESLFGYDRDDLIGQPVEMLLPEPLWQIYAEHKESYFADPRTRSSGLDLQLSGRHQDGTNLLVNISLSHIDTGDVLLVLTAVRDVTEQRKAVEVAQLTAAVVEFSNDAIIGSTLEGTVTSWNPAAERMYGYSSEEILGKNGSILTSDDLVDEFFANLASVRDGKAVEHLETTRIRKDKTMVPVSLTVAPIRSEDGVVVGASAVHRDVTQQRQAFEAARRIEAVVESSNDAIIGCTLEGLVTSWNVAAERLFGYSRQEIIGRSGTILAPENRAGLVQVVMDKVRSDEPVEHLEVNLVRKDATVVPVSVNVAPIRDVAGVVTGAAAVARDVTGQREAFEAAQRIAAIVQGSDDAIASRTLDGTITSWNPAAERMFGYSSSEIIGQSNELIVPKDRLAEVAAVVARIKAGQSVQHVETIRMRKDGTVFPVSLTFSPIRGQDGEIVGASVICRDMTDKEHAARYARSLIEAALDPMVTISPEGRIGDVNEATTKITGLPREALIGSDYAQYVTEPEKALVFFQQVFDQGSVTDFPMTVRHRDGSLTDVVCNASVYRDISGNVLGVLAAGHDVTRAKKAFDAAQRIAAIVENSEDAIIGSTLDRIITSWNPAAERMFGYSSQEIVGMSAALLTPENLTEQAEAIMARIRKGQPVERLETTRLRKDGTTVPVSLTISPIRDPGGTIVGVSAIHRVITAQKRAGE
jgi:PAS domain S-box-containing protein